MKQDCVEQAQAGRAGHNHDHDHKNDDDHEDEGNHDHDHKYNGDIVEEESSHGGGCENEDEDVVSKD